MLFRWIQIVLFALSCLTIFTEAGTITGTISAKAPHNPNETNSGNSDYDSRRYRFLSKIDYDSLIDFVVSIDGVENPPSPDRPQPQASIIQQNGAFYPHILPISVGTEVTWPNRDEIFHNVFSMSDALQFNLGYYKKKDDPKKVVFNKEGKIDVFCSIHESMNCVVLVLPNDWFSISDKRGRYKIENVPAGTYKLKAWHERLPSKYIDVVVPVDGIVELDIAMGLLDLPQVQSN